MYATSASTAAAPTASTPNQAGSSRVSSSDMNDPVHSGHATTCMIGVHCWTALATALFVCTGYHEISSAGTMANTGIM